MTRTYDKYLRIDNYFKTKYPNMKWEFYRTGFIRVYNPINNKIIKDNIAVSSVLLPSKRS